MHIILPVRLRLAAPRPASANEPRGDPCTRPSAASVVAAGLIVVPLPRFTQYAVAQAATPDKPAKPAAKSKKAPTAGQLATRERQKKCAAEWKEAKAGGKLEKGMKWPQFWSACNKRLKGSGA
jgi:hypothetical protein